MTSPERDLLRTPNLDVRWLPLASVVEAGAKGAGLLRLFPSWYPPTLVIAADVDLSTSHAWTQDAVRKVLRGLVNNDKARMLSVRSSARDESIDARGRYQSKQTGTATAEVEDAVREIRDHAASLDAGVVPHLSVLVQPLLGVRMSGHLSNEHRMSRDISSWVYEVQLGAEKSYTRANATWRVVSGEMADDVPLIAATVPEMELRLRQVARRLGDLPYRHHLEWVWDGARVWIVQADRVPPLVGPAPGDAYVPVVGQAVQDEGLQFWKALVPDVLQEYSGWAKVRAMEAFAAADLPIGRVWILQGSSTIEGLANGVVDPELESEIQLICSGSVIVRSDVKSNEEKFMLDKSETEGDPDAVRGFLARASRQLLDGGVAPDDICFLAHRYIRARACAWTLARPGEALVEVDSTWGLADGLGWVPHDTSIVNADTGRVRRSIGGKTDFLDAESHSKWTYRKTPTEWVWRASVTEDQLRMLARGALSLANSAGTPLLTMWFIGLLDGGEVECLPWFQAVHRGERLTGGQVAPSPVRIEVTDAQDLEGIGDRLASKGTRVVRLVPKPELVRSQAFVDQVISSAIANDFVVELVGSPLAHPYYMMRDAGVTVTCVGTTPTNEIRMNKLVRDQIGEIITAKGERPITYHVDGSELARLLKTKVVEESLEVLRSETAGELLDELADLEEVAESLRVVSHITRDDMRRRRREKREKRGGFARGVVLVRTTTVLSEDSDQPSLPGMDETTGVALESTPLEVSGDRVTLSSIPPLPDDQQVFDVVADGVDVHVEYTPSGIEVRVSPRPPDNEPPQEAPLFEKIE